MYKDLIIRKDYENELNAKSFTEMEIDHRLSECSQATLSLTGKGKTSFLKILVLGLRNQYYVIKVFNAKLGEWNQCLAEPNDMFGAINDNIKNISFIYLSSHFRMTITEFAEVIGRIFCRK